MNLNAMKQVAQKLGLTYDGELQYMPLAYGVLEGYTVVLYLDMLAARRNGREEPLEYKLSVAVKMGEELPEYADFQQICKEAPCPMRATVRDYRVTFYLGGNERNWKEQAEQGIQYLISTLREKGYENCDEQTGSVGETKVCFMNGGLPKLISREHFESGKSQEDTEEVGLGQEIGGSVLCTFLFAVFILAFGRIGGLIFWIIVAGVLNLLVELFCRICRIKKDTAENPRGFRILEILMALSVLPAERMSVALPAYLAFHEEGGVSLFYVFMHIEEMLIRQGVIMLWVMTGVNLLLVVLCVGVQYRLARFRRLHNKARILGEDRAAQ